MMGYEMSKENANAEVMDWLDYTANARIHQTLLQKPFDLLAKEQLQLLPLPKPYKGIHPLKATSRCISQANSVKPKQRVHIPKHDLQSYDEFIPAAIVQISTKKMPIISSK